MAQEKSLNFDAFTDEERLDYESEQLTTPNRTLEQSLLAFEELVQTYTSLESLRAQVLGEGKINQDTALDIKNIAGSAFSLPLGYFTLHSSTTHLQAALESAQAISDDLLLGLVTQSGTLIDSITSNPGVSYDESIKEGGELLKQLVTKNLINQNWTMKLMEKVMLWKATIVDPDATQFGLLKEVYSQSELLDNILAGFTELDTLLEKADTKVKHVIELAERKRDPEQTGDYSDSPTKETFVALSEAITQQVTPMSGADWRLAHDPSALEDYLDRSVGLTPITDYVDWRELLTGKVRKINDLYVKLTDSSRWDAMRVLIGDLAHPEEAEHYRHESFTAVELLGVISGLVAAISCGHEAVKALVAGARQCDRALCELVSGMDEEPSLEGLFDKLKGLFSKKGKVVDQAQARPAIETIVKMLELVQTDNVLASFEEHQTTINKEVSRYVLADLTKLVQAFCDIDKWLSSAVNLRAYKVYKESLNKALGSINTYFTKHVKTVDWEDDDAADKFSEELEAFIKQEAKSIKRPILTGPLKGNTQEGFGERASQSGGTTITPNVNNLVMASKELLKQLSTTSNLEPWEEYSVLGTDFTEAFWDTTEQDDDFIGDNLRTGDVGELFYIQGEPATYCDRINDLIELRSQLLYQCVKVFAASFKVDLYGLATQNSGGK